MVKAPGQHHQECLPTHFALQQSKVLNLSWCERRVPQAHRWQWEPAWWERTCRTCGWRRWPRWRRWQAWRRDWERPSRRCWQRRRWRWPGEGKYRSPCKMRSADFVNTCLGMLLPWQIDIRFCQLFCHEIEIVPSRITEYSGVERDSNSPRVSRCALIIKG